MSPSLTLANPLPLAQALIRCPSVTPEDAGALDVLGDALEKLGFACHYLTFGQEEGRVPIRNLYARLGQSSPNICFAGHTDVVPAGDEWHVYPFAGQISDGFLHGRGTADMKGAIACFVAAVARFLENGFSSSGSISLLITGDEEGPAIDGTVRVLEWLEEKGEQIDGCIVGEPTNPERIGEMIKVGRRGSLNCHLSVSGTQGHVAYPHLADNPLPRLLDMLKAVTAKKLDEGTSAFPPSNLELTSIDVGNRTTNIIPSLAEARFNIRFNDLHDFSSLETMLRRTFDQFGQSYELTLDQGACVYLTEPGHLTEAVEQAIFVVTGQYPERSTTGGTSDGRFIRKFSPVIEFGLGNKSIHKVNEAVPLDDMEILTKIYHHCLENLLGREISPPPPFPNGGK